MKFGRKALICVLLFIVLAVVLGFLPDILKPPPVSRPLIFRGAVIQQDRDPRRQVPIPDVEVSATNAAAGSVRSDSSGFFHIAMRPGIRPGEAVTLQFSHPDYQPLKLDAVTGDKIYVIRMAPTHREEAASPNAAQVVVSSVLVRYSDFSTNTVNIGSAVKTFQIVNTGNVPCNGHAPCSPDGQWKAAIGSGSLDAGVGRVFRNARVSCIAGPCPFTAIQHDGFSAGGQNIGVSIRDWSDTTTFLLQAEVFRVVTSEVVHESFPVILGQQLNFSLPPRAEGPSIEAKINGAPIIFPLGPSPYLSWADCTLRVDPDKTRVVWCQLKPGYRF